MAKKNKPKVKVLLEVEDLMNPVHEKKHEGMENKLAKDTELKDLATQRKFVKAFKSLLAK